MVLVDQLNEKTALIAISAEDKEGAIAAMVAQVAKLGLVTDEFAARDAVIEREKAISTAVGHGVALPHAKMKGIDDFVVAIGRLEEGVDFGASDGEAVRILVLILSPEARTVDHVKLMAAVTKEVKFAYVRQAIVDAANSADVLAVLREKADD